MILTIIGIILSVFCVLSLLLGIVGLFNKEDYSYSGNRSYNSIGPFGMAFVFGLIAYTLLHVQ